MTSAHSKTLLKAVVFLLACFAFWFVTAPANMAIQRIASGTGRGPTAILVDNLADWYESPMVYFNKIPALRRMTDFLEDKWCEILDAPETTP